MSERERIQRAIAVMEARQAEQVAKYGRPARVHDEELAVLDAELRALEGRSA